MRSAGQDSSSDKRLAPLDAQLAAAGLARGSRRHSGSAPLARRLNRAAPEELRTAAPTPVQAPNGVRWLPVGAWQKHTWLWHGFSTRSGGRSQAYATPGASPELNLGLTADDSRENVFANRRLLAEAVTGSPDTPLVNAHQIHSNRVIPVTAPTVSREHPSRAQAPAGRSSPPGWRADGLMTAQPGLLLGILTADCVPILVADVRRHAVAAFHAGWRGTVKRIVESGIGRMRLEFGSRPEDLIAAIGPAIGPCCYAVGEEVFSDFDSQFAYARELFFEVFNADPLPARYPALFPGRRAPGHPAEGSQLHVDLIAANRRQLLAAGLRPQAIQAVGGCTQCHPELFFSHRGSGGRAGRMMAVIGARTT